MTPKPTNSGICNRMGKWLIRAVGFLILTMWWENMLVKERCVAQQMCLKSGVSIDVNSRQDGWVLTVVHDCPERGRFLVEQNMESYSQALQELNQVVLGYYNITVPLPRTECPYWPNMEDIVRAGARGFATWMVLEWFIRGLHMVVQPL